LPGGFYFNRNPMLARVMMLRTMTLRIRRPPVLPSGTYYMNRVLDPAPFVAPKAAYDSPATPRSRPSTPPVDCPPALPARRLYLRPPLRVTKVLHSPVTGHSGEPWSHPCLLAWPVELERRHALVARSNRTRAPAQKPPASTIPPDAGAGPAGHLDPWALHDVPTRLG